MFLSLWQCVPYSPLLTTSSDPVLFSVYFWDQTVFWSSGLSLFPSVKAADGGGHGVSLAPCFLTCKSPHQWYKPEEVKRQRSHLASAGSLNNWKCLCSSLCTLLKIIYVPALLLFSSAAPPAESLSAGLCWSWDIPSIFWHLRAYIIEL